MAHRLTPRKGEPALSPDDALAKLRAEFAYVTANRAEAAEVIGDIIAKFIELKAPQVLIDSAVAARQCSYAIAVSDDEYAEHQLRFLLRPDELPFIGYSSRQDEQALETLLKRAAAALGYQIELI